MHDGQRQAAVDPLALNKDRASAALAVIAPLLRTCELQMLAQGVQQCGARIQLKLNAIAVHGELDGGHVSSPVRFRGQHRPRFSARYARQRHGRSPALQNRTASHMIWRHKVVPPAMPNTKQDHGRSRCGPEKVQQQR
jgi:hypothetical protein